jgi:hypothetical protein
MTKDDVPFGYRQQLFAEAARTSVSAAAPLDAARLSCRQSTPNRCRRPPDADPLQATRRGIFLSVIMPRTRHPRARLKMAVDTESLSRLSTSEEGTSPRRFSSVAHLCRDSRPSSAPATSHFSEQTAGKILESRSRLLHRTNAGGQYSDSALAAHRPDAARACWTRWISPAVGRGPVPGNCARMITRRRSASMSANNTIAPRATSRRAQARLRSCQSHSLLL